MRRVLIVLALVSLAFSLPLAAQQPPNVPAAIQIDSKILAEKRNILVRTPPSYRTGARAYPVVYLTDGDRQIEHTVAVADYLVREGRMPEVIVVGIGNTDRTRDLTPTHLESQSFEGRAFQMPTSGGADKFLDFLVKELIPHVEQNYRTQPYRVFAGHSFGGLFALHTLFTRPDVFDAVIAVSPSLGWDNRYLYRKATEWLSSNRAAHKTLVVSVGNEGAALDREFDALKALFEERGKMVDFQAIRLADEDHGSVVLPTHYAGLRRVFAPFRFAISPQDDPKTLWAKATKHFAAASKRLRFELPVPEVTANLIGYRLLQSGSVAEAIEVFRKNAETYPKSANVYDSLAEAYERAGELSRAKENYERAATIGKQTADPNTNVYEENLARVTKALAVKTSQLGS